MVASKEEATSSSSSGTVVSVPVSAYKNQPLHEQCSSVAHMSQKSAFQIDLARDRQQRYRQSAPPKCHVRRSRGSMVEPVCGGARMEALSSFLCSNADALRFCERVDAKHTCAKGNLVLLALFWQRCLCSSTLPTHLHLWHCVRLSTRPFSFPCWSRWCSKIVRNGTIGEYNS